MNKACNTSTSIAYADHQQTTDEDIWEDISDGEVSNGSRLQSPVNDSPRMRVSPKKHRPIGKNVKPRSSAKKQTLQAANPTEDLLKALQTFAVFSYRYSVDILSNAVYLLRGPLSIFLFVWLLSLIFSRIVYTLQSAFRPVCVIPLISSLPICQTVMPSADRHPKWANYPKLVDMQSATFEQLLETSVGGSALALNIKRVEMATIDLVTLTRLSDLKSRDLLAESLSTFVADARKTGRGLTKLSSRVGGTVDQILALNDYALHSIEQTHAKSPSGLALVVRSVLPGRSPSTNDVILQTFTDSMNVLSSSIQRLILEAEVELANLDKLEQDLFVIHEVISREDVSLSSAKSELLSELWTKLGGNRRALQSYNDNLLLLKDLSLYRKKALAQVMMALQALRTLSDDMEDLRERVANPELVESKIPVEVHLKSIKGGIERLKESRVRAKDQDEAALSKILTLTDE